MIKIFEEELISHCGWVGIDIDKVDILAIKTYCRDGVRESSKLLYPYKSNMSSKRSEMLYLNYLYNMNNPFNSEEIDLDTYINECGCSSFYENLRFIYNIFVRTLKTKKNPIDIIGRKYNNHRNIIDGLKIYYTFAIFNNPTDEFCKFDNAVSGKILYMLNDFFSNVFSDTLLNQVTQMSKNSIINGIGLNISSADIEGKVYMDCYCEDDSFNIKIFDCILAEYSNTAIDVIKYMVELGYDFDLVGLTNKNNKLRLYFKK